MTERRGTDSLILPLPYLTHFQRPPRLLHRTNNLIMRSLISRLLCEDLERVQHYCRILCQALATRAEYSRTINQAFIETIVRSSPLHDIGKVGIPDTILLKPDQLTSDEFEVMKTHSTIGGDTIRALVDQGRQQGFLTMGMEIAYAGAQGRELRR